MKFLQTDRGMIFDKKRKRSSSLFLVMLNQRIPRLAWEIWSKFPIFSWRRHWEKEHLEKSSLECRQSLEKRLRSRYLRRARFRTKPMLIELLVKSRYSRKFDIQISSSFIKSLRLSMSCISSWSMQVVESSLTISWRNSESEMPKLAGSCTRSC